MSWFFFIKRVAKSAKKLRSKAKTASRAKNKSVNRRGAKKGEGSDKNTQKKKANDDGCGCFAPGTLVLTEQGYRAIETIAVGELVAAKSDITHDIAWKAIEKIYRYNNREYFTLIVAGSDQASELTTTNDHPFWVVGKGWVKTQNLQLGDQLVNDQGETLEILYWASQDQLGETYNFEVADYHSFFVGDANIWVHNGDPGPCDLKSDKKVSKSAEVLQNGGKNTAVNVKSKAEANKLLNEAFPGYQKVKGVGPQDAVGIRKKRKMDRFKKGGTYHKDYAVDPKTGRVRGHGPNDAHGEHPHINVKRTDGTRVIINITGD